MATHPIVRGIRVNSLDSLLSFQVGPVQPFIEAARTLRDLWSGSFLLSWIVAHAMKPIHQTAGCEFITPGVDTKQNYLLGAVLAGNRKDARSTLPTIPNRFVAKVPTAIAESLRQKCLDAAQQAWEDIASQVRQRLHHKIVEHYRDHPEQWCRDWDAQVQAYFEMHCICHPIQNDDHQAWDQEWDALGQLAEMSRSVRHVPPYLPTPDLSGYFPPKCSLLGSFEQMGPGRLSDSRTFWEALTSPKWKGLDGTRLQPTDRFCAISLIKRFAWPVTLAEKLGLSASEQRYSDTSTIAANLWLKNAQIDPDQIRREHSRHGWNGQWLHWDTPNQDNDEETCPDDVFQRIQAAKQTLGKPPTYYAILHLDGDNMGSIFRGLSEDGYQIGPILSETGWKRTRALSARLTAFALHVQQIVEECAGELVYCGGDDILAVLPTATAIRCGSQLREAFSSTDCMASGASLSGGLAVVHCREDLRYALQTVRAAEKIAKQIDQLGEEKNAVTIAVCRHSGEHSMGVMSWKQAAGFNELVNHFIDKASDRWTYKLREQLHVLGRLPGTMALESIEAELSRLLNRLQESTPEFRQHVLSFFESYKTELQGPGRNWKPENEDENETGTVKENKIASHFITLCQSASFMARGRE